MTAWVSRQSGPFLFHIFSTLTARDFLLQLRYRWRCRRIILIKGEAGWKFVRDDPLIHMGRPFLLLLDGLTCRICFLFFSKFDLPAGVFNFNEWWILFFRLRFNHLANLAAYHGDCRVRMALRLAIEPGR